jgi:hypothetical protein
MEKVIHKSAHDVIAGPPDRRQVQTDRCNLQEITSSPPIFAILRNDTSSYH